MSTPTFDEQVAALRGKVEARKHKVDKPDATPEQWAAVLDYQSRRRSANPDATREDTRRRVAKWRAQNPERSREIKSASDARRRAANPEAARARQRARDARRRATGKSAEYQRKRRATSANVRMQYTLRSRLYEAVKGRFVAGSAIRDLGCSVADLKAHLERQFLPGMTWDNWGRGPGKWQIDHIYPLAKTDLSDRPQLLAACNWRNLQPLWFEDNVRKGDTVSPDAQALFDRLRAEFSAAAIA